MKIFSPPENVTSTKTSTGKNAAPKRLGPAARVKAAPSEKQNISEQEIREKLAAHVETSNTAKSVMLQKNSKQLGVGFMNEDVKPALIPVPKPVEAEAADLTDVGDSADEKSPSVKESHLLMSDVKLNDPKDPDTQEKLKSVLSKGAFNFSPKEREALDKILGPA